MKLSVAIGASIALGIALPALAQGTVAFAPVGGLPVPLQSISGRFTSLNPPNRHDCPLTTVTGRVVSERLVMAEEAGCGQKEAGNVLVNVELANPADAARMIVGSPVVIKGKFVSGEERRSGPFSAFFVIAQDATVAPAGSPNDAGSAGAPFTSAMLCQPPELDALAAKLGRDLCVQSTLVENLKTTGPALEAAARAPANLSPADTVPGDPNTISCRLDREHSALHLTAIACARNSYWAWYNEKWRDRTFLTPPPP